MNRRISPLKQVNLSALDFAGTLALIGVAFFLPIFVIPEVGNLISAATAIFAIVSGFFIADATGNYLRLQTLIAEENATLISIIHSVRTAAPEASEQVQESVDAYMIAQLDTDELDHMIITKGEFEKLMSSVDGAMRGVSSNNGEFIKALEDEQTKMISLNQEITLAARSNLTPIHWSILLILAAMVCVTVLAVRDGSLLMSAIAASMLLGAYGVLVVLRDVDNNRYLQRKLAFRNPQQVFQSLKRPPYYPIGAHARVRTPDQDGKYRTRGTDGKIVTVTS